VSTSDPSQLDDLSVTEELTAYLDGEVDAEHARRIEERLARDASYRQQLQELQRTWDMLDQLPQARVDDGFLRSTIEMVAQAAADDVKATQQHIPRRRQKRWLLAALGFGCAAALGFLIGSYLWPDADRQVLENLPLIEDFDVYQLRNPDQEFASLLLKAGLFLEDAESREPIPADLEGRREWVAARPAAKQDELRRNWERFNGLKEPQRGAIQTLAAELNADPQRKQLLEIEARYRQWYAGLKPPQHAELLALPLEERVKQIMKLREPPLTTDDLVTTTQWFEGQVEKHDEVLMSERDRREFRAARREDDKRRLGMMAGRAVWQLRGPDARVPFTDGDFEKLLQQLSPKAQAPLSAAEGSHEKWRIVQNWLWHAQFYVYLLSDTEREELRPLQGEDFYRQLREFMSSRFGMFPRGPWRGPGERPRGDRGGDRPGDRGPERRRGDDDRRRDDRRDRDREERRPASESKNEKLDSGQPASAEEGDGESNQAAPSNDSPATTKEDRRDSTEAVDNERSTD
jgi:hypothetical protein